MLDLKSYVYGLFSKSTKELKYIGVTAEWKSRYHDHLYKNTIGEPFDFQILIIVPRRKAHEIERHIIKMFKNYGCPLFNKDYKKPRKRIDIDLLMRYYTSMLNTDNILKKLKDREFERGIDAIPTPPEPPKLSIQQKMLVWKRLMKLPKTIKKST